MDVEFHILSKGETLYKIANHYKKSLKDLIAINNIEDPSNLKPGKKIILKRLKEKQSTKDFFSKSNSINDWRKYGPLEINWSQWDIFKGSQIAPAIH